MLATYRSRLLTSTLLVGAAFATQPAFAQDANPASQPKTGVQASSSGAPAAGISSQESAPPAEATSTGDIVVTGTLIRNPNLIASSPIAVIGQEEIQFRQANTAESILRDLPGAVPSIGSAVNNGNGGSAYVDLRGLGNFRNVVLLDGTRLTPSGSTGRTDLNNIPLALIQRVDTLTGGAATTYGADAVSGVINFITRSDFGGFEANVSNQINGKGDGRYFRADVTMGANFDDGRGNAVLSVGYQKSDPVYQGARNFSLNNYTSTSGGQGGSGTTVPGRFTLGTKFNTIDPSTGALRPYSKSRDAFNFNPYNIFQTPFKRYNIYGAAHYDVADNVQVYTRGLFSKNTVNTIVAPSGVFSQILTIPVSNPYLPAAARAQFCANNDFDPNTPGIQTLTPAQCDAAALATDPNDPNFRSFTTTTGRRTTEIGTRNSEYTTTYFDYRAGVKVGITKSIDLDLSGSYGESENRQTQDGYVLISRLRTAVYTTSTTNCNLGAAPQLNNPNPLLPPLAAGGASTSAGSGCVPVNIFGANGSISPNQIPYLTATATNAQKASLTQARALLSGDFGKSSPFANDPIGFAVGGEYRKYYAAQTADALSQTAGELGGAGGAVLNFNGSYEAKEAYGELIAPLVQDRPGFQSLTLETGIRYSAYKVFAAGTPKYNTTTYKAGGSWEPVDGIKFRGNYQRAVRAPNITELFTPLSTGLTNISADPCRLATAGSALATLCIAQGAPAASIGGIKNPTANQGNGTSSGATYLRPETSDSYTFGVVLQPKHLIPGFSVTADYYNILIRNAISSPSGQDLVNACFANPTTANPICNLIKRNPVTGQLDGDPATTQGVILPTSNAGKLLTDGIDLGVNYRRDLGVVKLNLSFQGNWTHRSQFQAIVPNSVLPAGAPGGGGALPATSVIECVGIYSNKCASIQPKFSWNQRTTLTFDSVDFSVLWRHIDAVNADPNTVTFNGTIATGALAGQTFNFGHINAYNYFDLATRFSVNNHFDFTISVMNLFDKNPPVVGGTIGSTSYNSGNTYPSTYDALGRRFAVGVRLKY